MSSIKSITINGVPYTIEATSGSADKLNTPVTISLTGDVSGSSSFDGSTSIAINASVADDSHNHIISNIDGLAEKLATYDSHVSDNAIHITSSERTKWNAKQDALTVETILSGTTDSKTLATSSAIKSYVDASVAGAVIPQGSATVADLSGVAKTVGYMYNMTDAGTIAQPSGYTGSPQVVKVGDNVVFTASGWDNFGGQIDLSSYLVKNGSADSLTVSFVQASSRTNIVTNETISTSFGKISKWLNDLGNSAFRDVDAVPTDSSTNLVESNGIYDAISDIQIYDAYVSTLDGFTSAMASTTIKSILLKSNITIPSDTTLVIGTTKYIHTQSNFTIAFDSRTDSLSTSSNSVYFYGKISLGTYLNLGMSVWYVMDAISSMVTDVTGTLYCEKKATTVTNYTQLYWNNTINISDEYSSISSSAMSGIAVGSAISDALTDSEIRFIDFNKQVLKSTSTIPTGTSYHKLATITSIAGYSSYCLIKIMARSSYRNILCSADIEFSGGFGSNINSYSNYSVINSTINPNRFIVCASSSTPDSLELWYYSDLNTYEEYYLDSFVDNYYGCTITMSNTTGSPSVSVISQSHSYYDSLTISNSSSIVSLSTSKQDVISSSSAIYTGIASAFDAGKVVITNSSGQLAVSPTITSTELGYLDGVTGNIQTQINNAKSIYSVWNVSTPSLSSLDATYSNLCTLIAHSNTLSAANTYFLKFHISGSGDYTQISSMGYDVEGVLAIRTNNSDTGIASAKAYYNVNVYPYTSTNIPRLFYAVNDNVIYVYANFAGTSYSYYHLNVEINHNYGFNIDSSSFIVEPTGFTEIDFENRSIISGTNPLAVSNLKGMYTITHNASGVTAGSYGPSSNQSPSFGDTFSVPYFSVNTYGHTTDASNKTITIPSNVVTTSVNGLMGSSDKSKLDEILIKNAFVQGSVTPADTPVPLTLFEKDGVKIYIQANSISSVTLYLTATPAVRSGFMAAKSSTVVFQANSANVSDVLIGSFSTNDLSSSGGYGHLVLDWSGHEASFDIMLLVSGSSCAVSSMVSYIY